MKKTIIMMGSVGAGVLLILAMFSMVVSAQTVKSNEIRTNILQKIKDKIEDKLWIPGEFLGILFDIFISLFLWFSIHFLT